MRRKKTTKRNIILNKTLKEVDVFLKSAKDADDDETEGELAARLDFLHESLKIISNLDEAIDDLITNDEEADKNELETVDFNLKLVATIKKIEKYFERKRLENERRRFGDIGINHIMDDKKSQYGDDGQCSQRDISCSLTPEALA